MKGSKEGTLEALAGGSIICTENSADFKHTLGIFNLQFYKLKWEAVVTGRDFWSHKNQI